MRRVVTLVLALFALLVAGGCSKTPPAAGGAVTPQAIPQPQAGQPSQSLPAPVDGSVPAVQGGEAAAAPAAPQAAAAESLPGYAGASVVGQEEKTGKGAFSHTRRVTLQTQDPFAKVKTFYQDAIQAGGWQVVDFREKLAKAEWRLTNAAGTVVEVEVEGSKLGGTRIEIEQRTR